MKTAKGQPVLSHQPRRVGRLSMGSASFLALALGAAISVPAKATSYNFEYDNPSPYYAGQPSQPSLAQIHLTKALHDTLKSYLDSSSSNTNVVVAIFDGLADTTHIDLAGHETNQIVYTAGTYTKYMGHGTHTSGIAGAAQNNIGIVGVNPFSTMLNIPVFDDTGWVATDLGKKALDAAKAQGARVVNMSYGSTVKGAVFLSGELSLFKNYNSKDAGQGMVLVRSAGNDAMTIKKQSFTGNASVDLSNLLIVGSVNSTNGISSYSNKPGTNCIGSCGRGNVNALKNFFIVAPGDNVISDLPANYVGLMSGTSMAAPHVTGAASLVFQEALAGNTQLTPGAVAEILKRSADDLGAKGVDSVYGWGLLDVAAALNPVGTTYFPTGAKVNSGLVVTSGSTIGGSSVVGQNSVASAISGAIILDEFGRAFPVAAPKESMAPSAFETNFLQELTGDVFATTTEIRDGGKSVSFLTSRGDLAHGGLSVIAIDKGGVRFESGLGGSVSYFSSVDSASKARSRGFSYTMAQNFLAGAGDAGVSLHQAMFFGTDVKRGENLTLSAIYLRTSPASFNVPDNIAATLAGTQLTSSLMKFGANYRLFDGVSAGTSFGVFNEHDQTLGMHSSGAFTLGDGVTYIGGANLSADLGPSTMVQAFAEHSQTANYDGANSILSSDGWSGSKYGFSLTQSGLLGLSGNFRLTLVRPWQVDRGSLLVHVPVGRELDGTVDFEDRSLAITNAGTPIEIGLGYLWGTGPLKYGAEIRMLDRDIASMSFSEVSLAGAFHWSF